MEVFSVVFPYTSKART